MNYEFISYDEYSGHTRVNFKLNGRDSLVVRPDKPLPGNPVAWRAEFFGAFDSVDVALLERGWHLCYHRVSDMYGCPESIVMMREFHEFVSETFGLGKTVLFGFSRGGLYSVNYAAAYPESVAGLYLDAPVLDIRSWPCSDKSRRETAECMKLYHLTDETLAAFSGNPIDKAAAVAHIPTIIVAGDSDKTVPYSENGAVFTPRFTAAGGKLEVILKPGCDHHPHSLEDPTPVVQFIEENCL